MLWSVHSVSPARHTNYLPALVWSIRLLLAGLALLFNYIKRRRDQIEEQPLTMGQRKLAEELWVLTRERIWHHSLLARLPCF